MIYIKSNVKQQFKNDWRENCIPLSDASKTIYIQRGEYATQHYPEIDRRSDRSAPYSIREWAESVHYGFAIPRTEANAVAGVRYIPARKCRVAARREVPCAAVSAARYFCFPLRLRWLRTERRRHCDDGEK